MFSKLALLVLFSVISGLNVNPADRESPRLDAAKYDNLYHPPRGDDGSRNEYTRNELGVDRNVYNTQDTHSIIEKRRLYTAQESLTHGKEEEPKQPIISRLKSERMREEEEGEYQTMENMRRKKDAAVRKTKRKDQTNGSWSSWFFNPFYSESSVSTQPKYSNGSAKKEQTSQSWYSWLFGGSKPAKHITKGNAEDDQITRPEKLKSKTAKKEQSSQGWFAWFFGGAKSSDKKASTSVKTTKRIDKTYQHDSTLETDSSEFQKDKKRTRLYRELEQKQTDIHSEYDTDSGRFHEYTSDRPERSLIRGRRRIIQAEPFETKELHANEDFKKSESVVRKKEDLKSVQKEDSGDKKSAFSIFNLFQGSKSKVVDKVAPTKAITLIEPSQNVKGIQDAKETTHKDEKEHSLEHILNEKDHSLEHGLNGKEQFEIKDSITKKMDTGVVSQSPVTSSHFDTHEIAASRVPTEQVKGGSK